MIRCQLLLFILLNVMHIFIKSCAEEILGCGGFAKSDIDIDFSQVEVKLYTKQGSLKDHTECAPNNGYYFLPLYDKGEYILKIQPPAGWSFEPREVKLNVDGINDPCSKGLDINFHFKGFAILGKVVSAGRDVGPKGVKVELLHDGKLNESNIQETITVEDGSFLFTPVPPGQYIVRAVHPKWHLSKDSVPVQLLKGNAEIGANSLIVSGYDVSGSVTSDDEPIKDVSFILFHVGETGAVSRVQGCDSTPIFGFKSVDTPICHVKSNEKGDFLFPIVPPGHYRVVPFYAGPQNIKFDVKPTELVFSVKHSSLRIDTQFQVKGFSVSGRVLLRHGGKGISGATVLVDDKIQTVTHEDGLYHLENMQAGSYKLSVQASDIQFTDSLVKITPNIPELSPIYPSAFKVCGTVAPHQLPPSPVDSSPRNVLIASVGSAIETSVVKTGRGNREFCYFLKPGKYEVSVDVTDSEKNKGLVFMPAKHSFEVVDRPILSGLHFSQLKVELSGQVLLLAGADGDNLPVLLRSIPAGKSDIRIPSASVLTAEGQYQFKDVLPGQYEITIDKTDWCWLETSHIINVGFAVKWNAPTFKQTGYVLSIISSHDTELDYRATSIQQEKQATKPLKRLSVPRGISHSCVSEPGIYEVFPLGCHGYSQPFLRYTLSSKPLELNAVTHTLGGQITSHENVTDLIMTILHEDDDHKTRLGPLKAELLSDEKFVYKFKWLAKEGQSLTFVPTASILLFSPARLTLVGPEDCTNLAVQFSAEKGHVIEGKVVPTLGGVKISVTIKGSDDVIVQSETEADGKFKFDPLPGGVEYQLLAEKEGYVLTGPDAYNIINAHKLAEIVVEVLDKADSKPLQGVLLSLSGGESFRRNSQTEADGQRTFSSLSPGEYYLRPMMKEYRFEPSSKMISVAEGATVNVLLLGNQVAFSAYGHVTSLNGDPQSGVVVEAVGLGSCEHYQEETSSETNGQFRIRGLHPECEYTVRVKKGPSINENIYRSTPLGINIKAAEGDITGLRLVIFHSWSRMDVQLLIVTPSPEYLRTLKAKLCREDTPDFPVHVVKLDSFAGQSPARLSHTAMIVLPSIPIDGRGYFVQLESSLSRTSHIYTTYAVHFRANHTFKQIRMAFQPEPRLIDQELGHSSYMALPILIIGALLWLNQHKLSPLFNRIAQIITVSGSGSVSGGRITSSTHSVVDHSAADAVMVEPVVNVRSRKTKLRKT